MVPVGVTASTTAGRCLEVLGRYVSLPFFLVESANMLSTFVLSYAFSRVSMTSISKKGR